MNILWGDTESRSEVDLRKVGDTVYAKHPSTQIYASAWAFGETEPVWNVNEPRRASDLQFLVDHVAEGGMVGFHNAMFDVKLLRELFNIDIPLRQVIDTAAVARAANLPGALEHLGQFFWHPKDMEGNRLMLKLSRPRKPSKANPDRFWTRLTKPEDFARTDAYCATDVDVMRSCFYALKPMTDMERDVFEATVRMNERGVLIDRRSVEIMRDFVKREKAILNDNILQKYGFELSQVTQIASFLGLPSVDKAALRDFLKEPRTPEGEEVARARQAFARASTAKLDAALMRSSVTGRDHSGIIYSGAERTQRWSSFGVQWHNVPRGMGEKQALAFAILNRRDFDLFRMSFPNVMETISGMLRGILVSNDGLMVLDYSQIEARLLAWLTDNVELLQAFERGVDVYKNAASGLYQVPVEDVTSAQRFMGKQQILGCGYGLSGGGFQWMLDQTYDVQIERSEADDVVADYRRRNPTVAKFWKDIERLIAKARTAPGRVFGYKKVRCVAHSLDQFDIILPSGRRLHYYNFKLPNGNWFDATCYGRLPGTTKYGEVKIYGGALTGHITQSTARDVMAEAIVRLDKAGFPLLLSVHDEVISERAPGREIEFQRTALQRPDWLDDSMPLTGDYFLAEPGEDGFARYRK